jgi:chaperonin cofactor prefoldin
MIPSLVEAEKVVSNRDIGERLTRIEEGQKYILREIDKRFEAMDKRFDTIHKRFEAVEREISRLANIFIGIVMSFTAIVAVTIGFAIWDRRTAIRPVMAKTSKLEEEFQKVVQVLKEVAKKDKTVAEALRYVGMV